MHSNGDLAPLAAVNGAAGQTAAPSAASLSPSLWSNGNVAALGPAYEIKFLLSEAQAQEVEARLLAAGLLPDPHSVPDLGGMYEVFSLACDDGALSVFYRDPRMKNRKYRVRRYGDAETVFLERKRSRQGKVRKRRVAAAIGDLSAVAVGRAGDVSHGWFVRELGAQGLAPVCRVRYLRRALYGAGPEGAMRVTFDRSIRGVLARSWTVERGGEERPLLEGQGGGVVCEFKFRGAMPAPLKAVVSAMQLGATGVSKYRACVRAFASELGVDLARDRASDAAALNGAGGGAPHA